jgi:hypothetical protein
MLREYRMLRRMGWDRKAARELIKLKFGIEPWQEQS